MKTLSLLALLLGAPLSLAAEVYEWTDAEGVRHFSSSQSHKEAKPAALPPLLREPAQQTSPPPLQSCSIHGGINCQAGADKDGSVICYDGYRDSQARHRFLCSTPKLQVADVSAARPDGSFTVYIRNETTIRAEGTKVLLRSVEGIEVAGSGPQVVEPLAMAEFVFKTSLEPGQKPAPENFRPTCLNCG